jgi:hypothetical protein
MSTSPPAEPRSTRWPWLRSVAYSLIVALSPAIWVVETQSCSGEAAVGPSSVERTGADLFSRLGLVAFDQLWVGAVMVLMLAIPFLAWRAPTPLARLVWHVAGLLSAMFGAMMTAMVVMFVLFAVRVVRPAGYLALLLGALPVIESVVRIVYGTIELRAARASPPAATPPETPSEPT